MSGHFRPDPKEPFARRVIMVAWEKGRPLRANIFMAEEVVNRRRLWILLSDLDKSQEQISLGIKDSCRASGMSVVIMGAEHVHCTGLVA